MFADDVQSMDEEVYEIVSGLVDLRLDRSVGMRSLGVDRLQRDR